MAGESSLTRTYTDIFTTTAEAVRPILSDIVTSRIPTFLIFDRAFGVKELLDGGSQLHFNVFKELTEATSYTDLGTLSTTRGTPTTRVIGEWKQVAAQVVVSGLDMGRNAGDKMIANLFVTRAEAAALSMAERLGGLTAGIYSDGTEGTPLQLSGLQSWVSTNTTAGTIGNLSRTNAFWQNTSLDVSPSFATNGLNQMRSLALRLSRGSDRPNLICFNRSTFENFHRAHQATLNYNIPYGASPAPSVASQAVLDLGVPTITWQNMAVIYDDFVPPNRAYMLTLRYFHLVTHEQRDFVLGEFVKPSNSDMLVAHIFWMGELMCTSLRNQGNLINTDAN